ncbi:hypothetical protein Vadar_014049 [Vaccinium darrowii]|uniref:Uncharacterized protein n=1 Tax=Vaccinium darrowii TaxID=229202 RepID=A0ACB7Z4C4_9ERIC|nr:hypothetical protein Vadar_014049 [Vaccinium darrowii]
MRGGRCCRLIWAFGVCWLVDLQALRAQFQTSSKRMIAGLAGAGSNVPIVELEPTLFRLWRPLGCTTPRLLQHDEEGTAGCLICNGSGEVGLASWNTLSFVHEVDVADPDFISNACREAISTDASLIKRVRRAVYVSRYGLGWRGGKWYANRKFKKEQLKLPGHIKPKEWQLKFLRRPLIRPRSPENAVKTSDAL